MREASKQINAEHAWMADDKAVLADVLAPFRGHIASDLGDIRNGVFYPSGEFDLAEILFARLPLVAKPRFGSDGVGVRWFSGPGDHDEILCLDHYLLQLKVAQAPYAARIWPHATNSIRILTVHLPGQPASIVAAVHRFGTSSSAGLDNWEQGGLSAPIDVETGRMGQAVARSRWGAARHSFHPDNGTASIVDAVVPQWRELVGLVRAMADHVPQLGHIGWDFAIAVEGPILLEMNANAGLVSLQVHGGLLASEAARAYYHHHGLL